jgi:hypothetical protein
LVLFFLFVLVFVFSVHDDAENLETSSFVAATNCSLSNPMGLNLFDGATATFDIDIENWGRVKAFPRAVAVVDEREKERDRYTPWLHREVQGRVAGPVVQLRFISLFPWSSADQQQ